MIMLVDISRFQMSWSRLNRTTNHIFSVAEVITIFFLISYLPSSPYRIYRPVPRFRCLSEKLYHLPTIFDGAQGLWLVDRRVPAEDSSA